MANTKAGIKLNKAISIDLFSVFMAYVFSEYLVIQKWQIFSWNF